MRCATSIAQCALEPAMSSAWSRRSKSIEALMRRMIAAGPPAKRPPHSVLGGALLAASPSGRGLGLVIAAASLLVASVLASGAIGADEPGKFKLGEFIPAAT